MFTRTGTHERSSSAHILNGVAQAYSCRRAADCQVVRWESVRAGERAARRRSDARREPLEPLSMSICPQCDTVRRGAGQRRQRSAGSARASDPAERPRDPAIQQRVEWFSCSTGGSASFDTNTRRVCRAISRPNQLESGESGS